MPLKYLLDTDIASYAINNKFPRVREKLSRVPLGEVGISVITEAELRFGVARRQGASRLQFAVEQFLLHLEILPWESKAAKIYADIRAALEGEGSPLGSMDMLIAAHALAVGSTLVTHDQGFRKVKGLKTEDWTR
jgi:tRNA(fMet)-specific endonuclease VapC